MNKIKHKLHEKSLNNFLSSLNKVDSAILKYILFILFSLFYYVLHSQVKEQNLKEIEIKKNLFIKKNSDLSYKLAKDDIYQKQADDLGDLLKHLPGITLKNYGGLGGLKTISSRGINGTHTGIYVDGFLQQNNMNGQVDLSNIQLNNVEEISFSYFQNENQLQAVSSYFTSSNLFISTSENIFSKQRQQLRYQLKLGSFGQLDNYLSAKYNDSTWYLSTFMKYRQASGNFPYSVENYNTIQNGTRKNNDLKEVYAGLNVGKLFKNGSSFKWSNQFQHGDKGLPGAVIFYNPTSSQRLYNTNITNNLDFSLKNRKNLNGKFYFSNKNEQLIYIDSSYLNVENYLKSTYYSNYSTLGGLLKFKISKLDLTAGFEEEYSTLKSSNFQSNIQRFHSRFILNLTYHLSNWEISVLGGFQDIINSSMNGQIEQAVFNPGLNIHSRKTILFLGNFHFLAKRTLRMPAFSELYYNQFGNTQLKPEIVNQASFGSLYDFDLKNHYVSLSYNTFVNSVENKIVAIPTKNLFVWSIQNVGKVLIYGIESVLTYERKLEKFSINSNLNYTFQRVLNNDKNSVTYLHQLAYMPIHTFNLSLNAYYHNFGFTFMSNYISSRYSLNQNNKANEVPAFQSMDCSISYKFPLKSNSLQFSFTVKNLANSSYQYIRNYVMPGRNYLLSLSYALH